MPLYVIKLNNLIFNIDLVKTPIPYAAYKREDGNSKDSIQALRDALVLAHFN